MAPRSFDAVKWDVDRERRRGPARAARRDFEPAELLGVDSAKHDAAVLNACLYVTLVNEALARAACRDDERPAGYVESSGGNLVHLATRDRKGNPLFWQVFGSEVPHRYELRALESAARKHSGAGFALTAIESPTRVGGVTLLPWETLV